MDTEVMKRRATAFHEAGHAIIAATKGIEVLGVSIIARDNFLGGCDIDFEAHGRRNFPIGDDFTLARTASFEQLAALAAGGIAEEMHMLMSGQEFTVESMRISTADDDDTIEQINNLHISNGDEPIDLVSVREHVVKLLKDIELWNAATRLAEDLLLHNELEGDVLDQHLVPLQKELELERAAVAGLISTAPFLLSSSMIALKTSGVCSHVNQ